MNTTSLPSSSLSCCVDIIGTAPCQLSLPATSIVLAAAVQGESHSFLATVRTWLRDLFTPASTQDLERRLSALGHFYARRAFGLQMADRSQHCTRSLSFMISTTEPRLQADVGCSNHIVSSH